MKRGGDAWQVFFDVFTLVCSIRLMVQDWRERRVFIGDIGVVMIWLATEIGRLDIIDSWAIALAMNGVLVIFYIMILACPVAAGDALLLSTMTLSLPMEKNVLFYMMTGILGAGFYFCERRVRDRYSQGCHSNQERIGQRHDNNDCRDRKIEIPLLSFMLPSYLTAYLSRF